MNGFQQGIECYETQGGLDSEFDGARRPLVGEQLGQGLEREQPLAFGHEPLLEGGLMQRESFEQISLVDGGSLDQSRRGGLRDQCLEGCHVDVNGSRLQSQGRSVQRKLRFCPCFVRVLPPKPPKRAGSHAANSVILQACVGACRRASRRESDLKSTGAQAPWGFESLALRQSGAQRPVPS
jgi:hypothetical protein